MATFTGSFRVRKGTSALWASADTVLADGELGLDTDLDRLKVGNGSSTWSTLAWLAKDPPFTHPPSTGWTAFNSGSVTSDVNGRVINLTAGTADMRGEFRTASISTNFTATFYFDIMAFPIVNNLGSGIVLKAAASAPIIHFGMQTDTGLGTGFNLGVTLWSNFTTFSAHYARTSISTMQGMPNWLRIRDNATTRFYEFSYNGIEWWTYFSHARTTGVTPDQIGWGLSAFNSGGAYTASIRLRHLSGVS